MCEITSQEQCHKCFTYWTTSIENCTFGTCLWLSDKNRKLNKDRFDVLSIRNYVIKKRPSHGTRHGNTERQRIYHAAHNATRKAKKHGHKTILDRFLNSPRHRSSKTAIGWDAEFCPRYDAIASEDISDKNGPMDQGDDYQEAKKTHQTPSQRSISTTAKSTIYWGRRSCRPQTGWRWYDHPSTSSSSSSWQAVS